MICPGMPKDVRVQYCCGVVGQQDKARQGKPWVHAVPFTFIILS